MVKYEIDEAKERERYLAEYQRYQDLHEKNLIGQDSVLIQLSAGIIAVIAAFGQKLIESNSFMAMLTIILFSTTLVQMVLGYHLSNRYFIKAKKKLGINYTGKQKLNSGLDEIIEGKINDKLNITSYATFLSGIICFVILVVIYVGGLNGR